MDVVAGLAAAVLWWALAGRSRAEEYQDQVLGRKRPPVFAQLGLTVGRAVESVGGVLIRPRTRRYFTAAGITPAAYVLLAAVLMGVLGLIGWGFVLVIVWSLSHALTLGQAMGFSWALLPGALAGWWLNQKLAFAEYQNWRKRLKAAVPGLVHFLSIRLSAGETPAQAAAGVHRYLTDPLRRAWNDALLAVREGAALPEALRGQVDERFGDPDLSAVLDRLYYYHENGVPAEPFGDLGEHMARLRSVQATYRVKRIAGPVQVYVMVGIMAGLAVTLVPYLIQVGEHLFA